LELLHPIRDAHCLSIACPALERAPAECLPALYALLNLERKKGGSGMEEDRTRDRFDFMMKEKHHSSQENSQYDSFDHFMFGGSRGSGDSRDHSGDTDSNGSGILSQIDLGEVLYHVDTLISSARELKPLFGKVKPYLDNFIDKNKS
jgi:hypothetical protein